MTSVLDATDNENAATIIHNPSKRVDRLSKPFAKITDTYSYVDDVLARVTRSSTGSSARFAEDALRLAGTEILKEKTNQRKTVVLFMNEEPQSSLNQEIRALKDANIFTSVIALGNNLDEKELVRKIPDVTLLYVVNDQDEWTKVIEEIKENKLTGKKDKGNIAVF